MTEQQRNTMLSRWRAGASQRQIARDLGLSRNTVQRVLAEIGRQRAGVDAASAALRSAFLATGCIAAPTHLEHANAILSVTPGGA